ncbi:MAG: nuclear transport factor 2 family protein [Helicobacter sp.]|nr:nuclear transport factor 2 family protein [Helicobacter sp.]
MKTIGLKEYEEITKIANLYLEGCKKGKSSLMKPAFAKNATINGEPIQTLFDGVDKAGASDCVGRVDILEVDNDIAAIRITMENYFGADYVDLHMLKKFDEGWKIVAKAFTDNK